LQTIKGWALIGNRSFLWFLLVILYLSLPLLSRRYPAFAGSAFFFLYVLSFLLFFMILLFLGLWGLFGLTTHYLRGYRLQTRHRTAVVFVISSLLAFIVVLILSYIIPHSLPAGSDFLPFDAAVWKLQESWELSQELDPSLEEPVTTRQKMLKDVVDHVLPGKTRLEIENLLGPSDDTLYFQSTGRDMIYYLGLQRDAFIRIDSEWLLIWLDNSGRFLRYEIYSD